MAITLVALSGDVADLIGDDFDSRRTKVWIEANVPHIADLDNNVIRLGTATATVASDGTFVFTDLVATGSDDTNLDDSADLQYRLWVDYPRTSDRGRVQAPFGWYAVIADSNIADLVEAQQLEPTWQGDLDAAVRPIVVEALADDPSVAAAAATAASTAVTAALSNAGVVYAAKLSALDATRVPDPQVKTSGGSANTGIYTLSRITTGLPTISGQVIGYGLETSRTGTLSGVISQMYAGSKSQTDPLRIPVTPAEVLPVAAYLWTDQASARARMDIFWWKSDGSASATPSTTGLYANIAASTWEQRVTTATVPADAAYCTPQPSIATQSGNTVTGAKARMTAVSLRTTYADGESVDWAWSGTAHASTAKKVKYTSAEVDALAQAKVDAHVAASDPHTGYLRKAKVPVLATNRALDPQLKTTGSGVSTSPTSQITTGLPTGFSYGRESSRTGTLSGVIAVIYMAPASGGQADALRIPVTPGETITAQGYGWTDQASAKARLDLYWWKSDGTAASTASTVGTYSNIAASTWETRASSAVVPTGAAYATPALAVATQSGSTVTGAKARATGLVVVTGTTAPAYGDGETSGWDWSGTAHASTSVQLFSTTAATAALPLTLVKSGNTLTLSRAFNGSQTLTQTMSLTGSLNGLFSMTATKVDGTQVHDTSDDITPIRTQNGTVGANHGYAVVATFTNPDAKTTADLGSQWTDTAGRRYVLLAIVGGLLVMGGDYTGTVGTSPTVSAAVAPTTNLTHVSGATHTAAVDYTTQAATSLYNVLQRVTTTIWADGRPVTADGTYTASEVVVRESYGVLDYGALYEAAKANVGTSFTSLTIAACVRVSNVFRWTAAGCRVTTDLTELKPTDLGQCGAVQQAALSDGASTLTRYVPGVGTISGFNWTTGVDMTSYSSSLLVTTADLVDATRPPTLSLDTLSVAGTVSVGFAIGYLPYGERGDEASRQSQRLTHAPTKLWDLRNTKKSYPTFTTAETHGWGHLRTEGFRAYVTPSQVATVLASKGDAASAWEAFNATANVAA